MKDVEIAQTPIGAAPFLGHEDDGSGQVFFRVKGQGSYWIRLSGKTVPDEAGNAVAIPFTVTDGMLRAGTVA